jgi:hypothetical protein
MFNPDAESNQPMEEYQHEDNTFNKVTMQADR